MTYSTNTFSPSTNVQSSSSDVNISSYSDTGTQPSSGEKLIRQGSNFYSLARTDIQQAQRFDITEQIERYHKEYGGSDSTNQSGLAASKSLNYAKAPTIQRAQRLKVTSFPFTFNFLGTVGLFGAENAYVRIDLDLDLLTSPDVEVDGWYPADLQFVADPQPIGWLPADILDNLDPPPPSATEDACVFYGPNNGLENCYQPVKLTNSADPLLDPKVSIVLEDKGTGNIYVDNWLETMLYTPYQETWGYNKIYLGLQNHFYIGIHARNTRELPYNVSCTIGEEYVSAYDLPNNPLVYQSIY